MIRLDLCRGLLRKETREEDALNVMMDVFGREFREYEDFWKELSSQGLSEDYSFRVLGHDRRDPFICMFLDIEDDAKGIYMKMWLSDRLTLTPIPDVLTPPPSHLLNKVFK